MISTLWPIKSSFNFSPHEENTKRNFLLYINTQASSCLVSQERKTCTELPYLASRPVIPLRSASVFSPSSSVVWSPNLSQKWRANLPGHFRKVFPWVWGRGKVPVFAALFVRGAVSGVITSANYVGLNNTSPKRYFVAYRARVVLQSLRVEKSLPWSAKYRVALRFLAWALVLEGDYQASGNWHRDE